MCVHVCVCMHGANIHIAVSKYVFREIILTNYVSYSASTFIYTIIHTTHVNIYVYMHTKHIFCHAVYVRTKNTPRFTSTS